MQAFIAFAVLTFVAATVGGFFAPDAWYASLAKPSWNPPNFVFGPVWTALYTCIAFAGWLAWRRAKRIDASIALWGAQLVANALWSYLFFGQRRPDLAFYDIVTMFVLIVACIVVFRARSFTASMLMIPYALWVAFAGALNFTIWKMNT